MNLTNHCCSQSATQEAPGKTARIVRPAVSTRNDESGAHLDVALPGVAKDRLKLSVHQGILSLEAGRGELNYEMCIQLADRLDGQGIQANLADGVLHAFIPLKEESKPRQIPII